MLIKGMELIEYSKNPVKLRAFLEERPDRIGVGTPSALYKNIMILSGDLDANLHVVGKKGEVMPMLDRTGKYSPSMIIPQLGNLVTTDPIEQRIGCDHIDQIMAAQHFVNCMLRFLMNIYSYIKPPSKQNQDDKENNDDIQNYVIQKFREIEEILKKALEDKYSRQCPSSISKLFEAIRKYIRKLSKDPNNFDLLKNCLINYKDWCPNWFVILQNVSYDLGYNRIRDMRHFEELLKQKWEKSIEGLKQSQILVNAPMIIRSLIVLLESARSQFHLLLHRESRINGEDILIQGAGDVSMNYWNVAYIGKNEQSGIEERLIYTPGERLDERQYSCLICWKYDIDSIKDEDKKKKILYCIKNGNLFCAGSKLSIGKLRFSAFSNESDKVRLVSGDEPINIRDDIKFALYGQLLAWEGKVVEPYKIIGEFSDLRHVLNLVNINDKKDVTKDEIEEILNEVKKENPFLSDYFSETETLAAAYGKQPRYIFGVPSKAPVWLGESVFLQNSELARMACEHPVDIKLSELGAPLDWITICMIKFGYKFKKNRDMVSDPGDFTWDIFNPTDPKLVWFPYPATYPCSMIGIGVLKNESKGSLFLLEWGHRFDEDQKYNIFDCAQILCDLGAQAVLLIDEGQDVFLHHFPIIDDLDKYLQGAKDKAEWHPVPPAREQIRGTLAFWVNE